MKQSKADPKIIALAFCVVAPWFATGLMVSVAVHTGTPWSWIKVLIFGAIALAVSWAADQKLRDRERQS